MTNIFIDWSSRSGADILVQRIQNYWKQNGFEVQIRVFEISGKERSIVCIRSDLKNGIPCDVTASPVLSPLKPLSESDVLGAQCRVILGNPDQLRKAIARAEPALQVFRLHKQMRLIRQAREEERDRERKRAEKLAFAAKDTVRRRLVHADAWQPMKLPTITEET
jgi:hypothetical protein